MPDARRRKEQMNMPAYNAGEIDEGETRSRNSRAQDIEGGREDGGTGKARSENNKRGEERGPSG